MTPNNSKKSKNLKRALCVVFALVFATCGCESPRARSIKQVNAVVSPVAHPLENGMYFVLREATTLQGARVEGVPQVVLAYDRRKYSEAPPNEPLTYVAIDPTDYIPLLIEGVPEMKTDAQGKSILSVSLARKNIDRTETFTRAHLGGKIVMLIDGEIVTLHKIRSVITGGKLQITRCTDNACQVIRAKLVK
jgi:hypothetical protein